MMTTTYGAPSVVPLNPYGAPMATTTTSYGPYGATTYTNAPMAAPVMMQPQMAFAPQPVRPLCSDVTHSSEVSVVGLYDYICPCALLLMQKEAAVCVNFSRRDIELSFIILTSTVHSFTFKSFSLFYRHL